MLALVFNQQVSTAVAGDVVTIQGGQTLVALANILLLADVNTAQGQGVVASGSESLAADSSTSQASQTSTSAGSEGVSAQSSTSQGQGTTANGSGALSAQGLTAQGQTVSSSGFESVSGTVATAQGGQTVDGSDIPAVAGTGDTGQGSQGADASGLVSLESQQPDVGGDGAWRHLIFTHDQERAKEKARLAALPEPVYGDAVTAQIGLVVAVGSVGVKASAATRAAQAAWGMGNHDDVELEQFMLILAEAA